MLNGVDRMNIIEIKDLSFTYNDENNVLSDVNLEIEKGEWVSILGHNGSGKSTLSKLIIGLLKADKGEIIVDGITLDEKTVHDVRKKIGIVFQNPDNQFVGVTVEDDIAFGMENLCFDREDMMKRIKEFINDSIDNAWQVGALVLGFFGINVAILEFVQKRFKNDTLTTIVAVIMFLFYGVFVVWLSTPMK